MSRYVGRLVSKKAKKKKLASKKEGKYERKKKYEKLRSNMKLVIQIRIQRNNINRKYEE